MGIKTKLVAGGKNVTLHVTGTIDKDLGLTPIFNIGKLDAIGGNKCYGVRLDSASWLIQEKLGIILWWDKDNLILPMESRNFIRLDHGIDSPRMDVEKPTWQGNILLTTFGLDSNPIKPKHFFLVLDFDRQ